MWWLLAFWPAYIFCKTMIIFFCLDFSCKGRCVSEGIHTVVLFVFKWWGKKFYWMREGQFVEPNIEVIKIYLVQSSKQIHCSNMAVIILFQTIRQQNAFTCHNDLVFYMRCWPRKQRKTDKNIQFTLFFSTKCFAFCLHFLNCIKS